MHLIQCTNALKSQVQDICLAACNDGDWLALGGEVKQLEHIYLKVWLKDFSSLECQYEVYVIMCMMP